METRTFDAFFSYTHEDNDRGGGRVLALAESLRDEFALTTGDELDLFVDRSSLAWGDLWRARITDAIGEVPLLIPVVTPKFVKSEECRRELIQFVGQARSKGLERLLLPILFIDVQNMNENSDDEVLAIIARTQYVDWTKLRLMAPGNPAVLQSVNELALRIRDLRSEASAIALETEPSNVDDSFNALKRALDEINVRLDDWMESVDFDKVGRKYWWSAYDARIERVERIRKGRAAKGAELSIYQQLGRELLPIAVDRLEKAKNYARLTIELDPYVRAAIRLVGDHPEYLPQLDGLLDGINEAYLNIEPEDPKERGYGMADHVAAKTEHLSTARSALDQSFIHSNEGNEVVLEWRKQIMALSQEAAAHEVARRA